MSSTIRAWVAALSIGAVRSVQQNAKNKNFMRLPSLSKQLSSAVASTYKAKDQEKLKESEESLRKVMYLSSWGPN